MKILRPSGERDVAAVRPLREWSLRLIAVDRSARCRYSRESRVSPRRSSVFGVPPSTIHTLGRPVLLLHLDVDPGVRVDPLELDHLPPQPDRCVGIELGAERVVTGHRYRGGQKATRGQQVSREFLHGTHLSARSRFVDTRAPLVAQAFIGLLLGRAAGLAPHCAQTAAAGTPALKACATTAYASDLRVYKAASSSPVRVPWRVLRSGCWRARNSLRGTRTRR